MKEKLIIFGTGHLVKEIIEFTERYELFEIVGFTVNNENMRGREFYDRTVYPVEELENYFNPNDVKVFLAISWYHKLCKVREGKFQYLKDKNFKFANLISPNAIIQSKAIGEGNWVMDQVYIGHDVQLGNNNVLLLNSSIAHYSNIGSHNLIGAKANILGHVNMGDRCFIGSSSVIFNKVTIANKCVIGAGSVVKKDLKDCSVTLVPKCKVVQMDEESVEDIINVKNN